MSLLETARLGDDERLAYRERGFVVPRWRLPAQRVGEMGAALDRLIAENPRVRPEHLVLRWGGGADALPTHARFLAWALDPAILDVVEGVLGPDIILWGAHVFCKPAGTGLEVPWHQDGAYWPIRPLASCTVWVAIDDSSTENGCLRVVPGSHRARTEFHHRTDERPHLAIDRVVTEGQFDEASAEDVVLKAGQMSLHDVFMIHGSRPNRSPRRRAGFAIRYMPATSLYDRTLALRGGSAAIRQNMAMRPIFLARGVDRHGGNDFVTGHDKPYEVGGPD